MMGLEKEFDRMELAEINDLERQLLDRRNEVQKEFEALQTKPKDLWSDEDVTRATSLGKELEDLSLKLGQLQNRPNRNQ